MRLSTKGRYAVRAMVDLALHTSEGPVTREDIARRQGISALYLAQLFAKLIKAGLVESVKGPGGGYVLSRDARQVRASDIIRAVQEPLAPAPCVDAVPRIPCPKVDDCSTYWLWKMLGDKIVEALDSVTLAELRDQAGQPSTNWQTSETSHEPGFPYRLVAETGR
ncbi:MAG: Rrf2 family transcriptional regulator [Chloroflexota bacterium]